MSDKQEITKNELDTYWKIFSANANGGSYLDSQLAVKVLRNSNLPDDQLESVWDLADFDSDGKLDFEEFCVAMKLTFQLVNGEIPRVPETLPDWLVPESKGHFVQASRALKSPGLRFEGPSYEDEDDDEDDASLKDGFDWYITPEDRHKYEEIYTANRNRHGDISFSDLNPLYTSLDIPDTDIRSAWNLINPSAEETIGKDSCLAFLHILNNRHEGYRIPRTVPASLRASFERGNIDYRVDSNRKKAGPISAADRWGVSSKDDDTVTGRKAKFGDTYLSRLGIGDRSRLAVKKTDFSSTPTTKDWEVVRLKNQLKEIEDQMEAVEQAKEKRRDGGSGGNGQNKSKPALVKRELEQMFDHKRRELRDLEDGKGTSGDALNMSQVQEDIQSVREQVTGLEEHLRRRQDHLTSLKRLIQDEQSTSTH